MSSSNLNTQTSLRKMLIEVNFIQISKNILMQLMNLSLILKRNSTLRMIEVITWACLKTSCFKRFSKLESHLRHTLNKILRTSWRFLSKGIQKQMQIRMNWKTKSIDWNLLEIKIESSLIKSDYRIELEFYF